MKQYQQILQTKWLLNALIITICASLILLMISQVTSTITARHRVNPHEPIWISAAFASGFDLFVCAAIAIGWRWCAAGASVVVAMVNIYCYNKYNFAGFDAWMAVLLSCVQPGVVYAYSEILHRLYMAKAEMEESEQPKPGADVSPSRRTKKHLADEIEHLKGQLKRVK